MKKNRTKAAWSRCNTSKYLDSYNFSDLFGETVKFLFFFLYTNYLIFPPLLFPSCWLVARTWYVRLFNLLVIEDLQSCAGTLPVVGLGRLASLSVHHFYESWNCSSIFFHLKCSFDKTYLSYSLENSSVFLPFSYDSISGEAQSYHFIANFVRRLCLLVRFVCSNLKMNSSFIVYGVTSLMFRSIRNLQLIIMMYQWLYMLLLYNKYMLLYKLVCCNL